MSEIIIPSGNTRDAIRKSISRMNMSLLSQADIDVIKRLFAIDLQEPEVIDDIKEYYRCQQNAWEALRGPSVSDYFTTDDVEFILNMIYIQTSYSKTNKIDAYRTRFEPRGLIFEADGFNRAVFRTPGSCPWVVKIPFDSKGLSDAEAEYTNQHLLKPFVTKIVDYTTNGTISIAEYVTPFRTRVMMAEYVEEIFYLLDSLDRRGYVFSDLGSEAYQNFGIRQSTNPFLNDIPVLLDFPYIYKVTGGRKRCTVCGGRVDIDGGFNNYCCVKCGAVHDARSLGKPIKIGDIDIDSDIYKGGTEIMNNKLYGVTSFAVTHTDIYGNEINRTGEKGISFSSTVEPPTMMRNPRAVSSVKLGRLDAPATNGPVFAVTMTNIAGDEICELAVQENTEPVYVAPVNPNQKKDHSYQGKKHDRRDGNRDRDKKKHPKDGISSHYQKKDHPAQRQKSFVNIVDSQQPVPPTPTVEVAEPVDIEKVEGFVDGYDYSHSYQKAYDYDQDPEEVVIDGGDEEEVIDYADEETVDTSDQDGDGDLVMVETYENKGEDVPAAMRKLLNIGIPDVFQM